MAAGASVRGGGAQFNWSSLPPEAPHDTGGGGGSTSRDYGDERLRSETVVATRCASGASGLTAPVVPGAAAGVAVDAPTWAELDARFRRLRTEEPVLDDTFTPRTEEPVLDDTFTPYNRVRRARYELELSIEAAKSDRGHYTRWWKNLNDLMDDFESYVSTNNESLNTPECQVKLLQFQNSISAHKELMRGVRFCPLDDIGVVESSIRKVQGFQTSSNELTLLLEHVQVFSSNKHILKLRGKTKLAQHDRATQLLQGLRDKVPAYMTNVLDRFYTEASPRVCQDFIALCFLYIAMSKRRTVGFSTQTKSMKTLLKSIQSGSALNVHINRLGDILDRALRQDPKGRTHCGALLTVVHSTATPRARQQMTALFNYVFNGQVIEFDDPCSRPLLASDLDDSAAVSVEGEEEEKGE